MTATPDRILDIAIGFMGAKQLDNAARIGLFTALADGDRSIAELAAATQRSERQVRILADAMNGLGLLDRADGRYSLATDARRYLAGTGPIDLTPFLAFLGDISYRQWLGYDATVDSDEAGTLELDEAGWADFMSGVMTYNELHVEQFAEAFDLQKQRSILDFGGLTPGFSFAALAQHPGSTARFVYAPGFADGIASEAEAAGYAARTVVEEAPTETAMPGGEHDLVLLAGAIHRFTADENRHIFRAARDAAVAGGEIFVVDFFLDGDERQRPIDALHAGEYFNIDGTVVYPIEEVREWLSEAGWRTERLVELPGAPRVLVATAV